MSNFKVWIDNPASSQVVISQSTFNNSTQRKNGFVPGTTIECEYVNTALRQATLVTSALMDVLDPTSQLSTTATTATAKSFIQTALNNIVAKMYKHKTRLEYTYNGKTTWGDVYNLSMKSSQYSSFADIVVNNCVHAFAVGEFINVGSSTNPITITILGFKEYSGSNGKLAGYKWGTDPTSGEFVDVTVSIYSDQIID